MNYTTTVINQYYEIDADKSRGTGEIYVLAAFNISIRRCYGCRAYKDKGGLRRIRLHGVGPLSDQYECRGDDRESLIVTTSAIGKDF